MKILLVLCALAIGVAAFVAGATSLVLGGAFGVAAILILGLAGVVEELGQIRAAAEHTATRLDEISAKLQPAHPKTAPNRPPSAHSLPSSRIGSD